MSVHSMPVRSDAEVAGRVDALIAGMTTAEKAGQLTQYFYFDLPPAGEAADRPRRRRGARAQRRRQGITVEEALARGEVGSLLFVTDPAEINRLQRLAVEGNRHGIPVLFGFDVIHGLRTIFPVPIAMAASWDPGDIERGQAVAAREARAVGIHWAFAPMVDIARDPRWGRIVEGAGEDPYLGAAVAAAQVRGFQGDGLGAPDRVIAGPKHFAGYGAALGGRDYDEVNLSDSELWNVYLPPFKAAVEAGAGNIMTAYMDLNGVPATGNRWLFTEVLRDTWGFDGFVVSDANAVRNLLTHGFAADLADAGARALMAGVDMEMAIADPAYAHLPEAIAAGQADEEALDASVRRVLAAKLRMGLFDEPYVDEDRAREVLADPAHREVARESAQRSAVLLRNEGGLLPLAGPDSIASSSIAVIGPLADSRRDTLGPWVFDFDLDETVTVLDGIRNRAGARGRGRLRPGRPPRPAGLPVDVRHVRRQRARRPGRLRRRRRARPRGRAGPRVRRRGRRPRRVAEHDRRGGLPLLPRAPRPAARAAAGRRRHRHAGRAAGDERPPARPALGRGARAGDPRHLVPRHPGRHGRRQPALRRRLAGRQAAVHLAADGRPGADDLRHTISHEPDNQAGATGTRRARRCSRSATG